MEALQQTSLNLRDAGLENIRNFCRENKCENEFNELVATRKPANLFSVIDDVYRNAEADKNKDDAEMA